MISTKHLQKATKNPFSLYRRKSRGKEGSLGCFYVQYRCPNAKSSWTTAKSTGTTDYNEAVKIAWKWYGTEKIPERINSRKSDDIDFQLQTVLHALRDGQFSSTELEKILKTLENVYGIKGGIIPNTSPAITIETYLSDFWNPEKSQYLREKRMAGKGLHMSHITMMQMIVRRFWIPKYGDREIGSFTKKELQEWLWELKETKFNVGQKHKKMEYLSAGYLNRILAAGLQAFKYAHENELIFNNYYTGFVYLKPNPKQKDILSLEEAEALFKRDWNHPTAKLGNQVAMLTGLRIGEILALKKKDLLEDKIHIERNYSVYDGLKAPKNGKERYVPAGKELLRLLRKQADTNPYNQGDEGFIFWSTSNPDKPFDKKIWGDVLKEQLKAMNVSYGNITFHSWRHFFSTYIEPHLKQSDLQKVTGHLTQKMLAHYANHQTEIALKNVSKAIDTVLLPIASLA
jgi:integrase